MAGLDFASREGRGYAEGVERCILSPGNLEEQGHPDILGHRPPWRRGAHLSGLDYMWSWAAAVFGAIPLGHGRYGPRRAAICARLEGAPAGSAPPVTAS